MNKWILVATEHRKGISLIRKIANQPTIIFSSSYIFPCVLKWLNNFACLCRYPKWGTSPCPIKVNIYEARQFRLFQNFVVRIKNAIVDASVKSGIYITLWPILRCIAIIFVGRYGRFAYKTETIDGYREHLRWLQAWPIISGLYANGWLIRLFN